MIRATFSSASEGRERLTAAIASGQAPHLAPILEACRDCGIAWGTVSQRAGKFIVPTQRPTVLIVGDDMYEALGQAGFHRRSLRRYIETCGGAVVVSCAAYVRLYTAAAAMPMVARRNSILFETRIERETEWLAFLREIKPAIRLLLGTVKPDGGMH